MNDIRILMKTSKGDIALTLLASRTPVTVANFLNLTQRGYYNGLKFHRTFQPTGSMANIRFSVP